MRNILNVTPHSQLEHLSTNIQLSFLVCIREAKEKGNDVFARFPLFLKFLKTNLFSFSLFLYISLSVKLYIFPRIYLYIFVILHFIFAKGNTDK